MNFFFLRLRYDHEQESRAERPKFNLLSTLRALVTPSAYRRMTVVLQTMTDDERGLLLRWSGHVDTDPTALLNLINESS